MNMFCRILIVAGNLLFVPIMLPIKFIWAVILYIKDDMRSYGLTFMDFMGAFIEGIIEGLRINVEFLKTGDLELFDI